LISTLPKLPTLEWFKRFAAVFRFSGVAVNIVWRSSAALTVSMALATLFAGILPAAIAWVGQLIVDSVVTAIQSEGAVRESATSDLLRYIIFELGLVVLMTGAQKINTVCQSILVRCWATRSM
jgi:ATP-binding cassette, subfamily B, bacterial